MEGKVKRDKGIDGAKRQEGAFCARVWCGGESVWDKGIVECVWRVLFAARVCVRVCVCVWGGGGKGRVCVCACVVCVCNRKESWSNV